MTPVMTSWGKAARLAAASVVLVLALGAAAVAHGPGRFTTYAGRSELAAALTVTAGLVLALAGLSKLLTRPGRSIGDVALVAALLWFAPVFVGWQVGPPLVRSFAMLFAGLSVPLLFHMVLASPTGRLRSTVARVFVFALYAEAALVALGLALFRDPYLDPNCWANCTDNVFLLRPLPELAQRIAVADRWITAAASAALILACGRRLLTESGPIRRVQFAVLLPAILLAGAIIAHAIALQRVPLEDPSNSASLVIFDIESTAVVLLAVGLISIAVRTILQRHTVSRIVRNVGEVPLPGSLESALGRALGDAELRIAYWLPESRRYVDATGKELEQPDTSPRRRMTKLVQGDDPIAVVSHSAEISGLEREIGAAVRLGLENERLQSQLLFQLDELQASRMRIVEKGDAERRRLERDLHDGAQQQLLALSYDIRLARATAAADADVQTGLAMEEAMALAQSCLTELRELAHGIYPAILTESGLGPTLATFADEAPLPVEIRDSMKDRLSPAVETAAYLLVTGALEDAGDRGARFATVSLSSTEGRLIVSIEDDGAGPRSSMDRLADRVGAIGGSLIVEPTGLRADLPCA